ncbi:MAG: 2-C-methyl-D-erythritol 4-phosphate cytidylyltransferase [Bryobacteraceae bacterium]|nr:2-C-methyl-D-erythritol 4-phosphate cytidylyltransferase [Bryobacteraceae bacterium]
MKVAVILPAAGLGTRMKSGAAESAGISRKQFMLLEGSPILIHTVRKFLACPLVGEVVIALRTDDIEWVSEMLARENFAKPVRLVPGGEARQHSVENALDSLAPDVDIVAVHDAVRPFVASSTITEVIEKAAETGAAIVGIVPVDTVKQVQRHVVQGTLNRDRLVLAQTPQVFRAEVLRAAFQKAREDGFIGTDESSLVERLDGVEVTVVAGSDRNIKITRPSDIDLARLFLREEQEKKEAPAE